MSFVNFTGSYTEGKLVNYFFMLPSQFPTVFAPNLFKMSEITLSGNTSEMSFPMLLKWQCVVLLFGESEVTERKTNRCP